MRSLVMASMLLTAAGCAAAADGPPRILIDKSACSHCGMLISEPIYAAAYRVPGSAARAFDDIGCLIAAARQETSTALRVWFHDGGDGTWIDGDAAVFVASPGIRTPMGGGMLAYRDERAAIAAAGRHRGEVVRSLSDLMHRTGEKP